MNNSRIRVEFKGTCLNEDKVTFTPNNAVNLDDVNLDVVKIDGHKV